MPLKSQMVTSSQCAQQSDRWGNSLNVRENIEEGLSEDRLKRKQTVELS